MQATLLSIRSATTTLSQHINHSSHSASSTQDNPRPISSIWLSYRPSQAVNLSLCRARESNAQRTTAPDAAIRENVTCIGNGSLLGPFVL